MAYLKCSLTRHTYSTGEWVPVKSKDNNMAHAINSASTGFNLIARIRGFFEAAATSWVQASEYKRTYTELDKLTGRELADIGVRRCDIAEISRIHVYGK